jgi:hypothetical protein
MNRSLLPDAKAWLELMHFNCIALQAALLQKPKLGTDCTMSLKEWLEGAK